MKLEPQKRWIVRAGDGDSVAEIVRRAGADERAVEEGRVFVGRVRVKSGAERVRPGDEVKIGASAPASADAWSVLWEQDGLLACVKPAGIPTVADHGGASHALVALAARSIGKKSEELFVTSRLDRDVSGVVVLATSAEAEGRLRRARERGRYHRRYVAIATATALDAAGPATWNAPIGAGKDARHRAAFGRDSKAAETRWAIVARAGGFVMLAVEPQTGRTHQIRVHAAHAGAPLLGDRDYGGPARVTLANGRTISLGRIALHAARVTVPGARDEPLVAEAPVPLVLMQAWSALGGAAEAWDRALSCEVEA